MENLNEQNSERWVADQLSGLASDPEWQPNTERAFTQFEKRDRAIRSRRRILLSVTAIMGAIAVLCAALPSARTVLLKTWSTWSSDQTAEAGRDTVSYFDLENIAGGRTTLADIKGKVAVVDLWATWCQPCLDEIPKYNELTRRYQGKNVAIVGIAVESPHDDVVARVKDMAITYTVLVGNQQAIDAFGGLFGFPTTFVLSKDGKIYKSYMGVLPNKHETIAHDVDNLLGEEYRSSN
jgi:thiol-disulfide isomerase/thioredoxin